MPYRVSTIARQDHARPDFFSVFSRNLAGKEASLGYESAYPMDTMPNRHEPAT
jgi:hypothetical protein